MNQGTPGELMGAVDALLAKLLTQPEPDRESHEAIRDIARRLESEEQALSALLPPTRLVRCRYHDRIKGQARRGEMRFLISIADRRPVGDLYSLSVSITTGNYPNETGAGGSGQWLNPAGPGDGGPKSFYLDTDFNDVDIPSRWYANDVATLEAPLGRRRIHRGSYYGGPPGTLTSSFGSWIAIELRTTTA